MKAILTPPIVAGWPAVEYAACLLPSYSNPNLKIQWSSKWNEEFDDALNVLPELDECPHDLYRLLVVSENVPKLHALVTEGGEPTAVISLRRCLRRWEPVTYQSIPKVIAPAVSQLALGRALNALGLEVRVPAGIGPEVADLRPRLSWSYDWYEINLQGDYEAFWRKTKKLNRIRRARERCADMECRVDGDGDLEWIVHQWSEQWRDDPGQETVAAEDRLRLWSAMMREPSRAKLKVHTLMLHKGAQRISGIVVTSFGDGAMNQCGGRLRELDGSHVLAATILSVVDWAKAQGFKTLDLAGGLWKREWGPVGGVRHGACFRSPLIAALDWMN